MHECKDLDMILDREFDGEERYDQTGENSEPGRPNEHLSYFICVGVGIAMGL